MSLYTGITLASQLVSFHRDADPRTRRPSSCCSSPHRLAGLGVYFSTRSRVGGSPLMSGALRRRFRCCAASVCRAVCFTVTGSAAESLPLAQPHPIRDSIAKRWRNIASRAAASHARRSHGVRSTRPIKIGAAIACAAGAAAVIGLVDGEAIYGPWRQIWCRRVGMCRVRPGRGRDRENGR